MRLWPSILILTLTAHAADTRTITLTWDAPEGWQPDSYAVSWGRADSTNTPAGTTNIYEVGKTNVAQLSIDGENGWHWFYVQARAVMTIQGNGDVVMEDSEPSRCVWWRPVALAWRDPRLMLIITQIVK